MLRFYAHNQKGLSSVGEILTHARDIFSQSAGQLRKNAGILKFSKIILASSQHWC